MMMHESESKAELSCPVCLLPLSIAPSFRAHGPCGNQHQTDKKINIGRYRPGKIIEINIVVSALCGHLFHKLCLRHYCSMYKDNTEDFDGKIECPLCLQKISFTKVLPIDYKSCLSFSAVIEKDYRHSLSMNEELTNQWDSTVNSVNQVSFALEESQRKLQSSKDQLADLCKRIGDAKSKESKRDVIINDIKHSDRMIDMTHKENIQLIKMYLKEMKGKPDEFLQQKRIPQPLIPYLHTIMEDEELLGKFGEVLKPVEVDGLRCNMDILIKEIFDEVKSTEITRKHNNPVANLLQHHLIKRKNKVRGARALVKVRRSSATLLNGAAEGSMQQIMKNVKEPIKTQRNAHEKIKPKIVEGTHRSGSEIQVLLEPKKKRHDVTESKLERLPVGDSKFIERNPLSLRRCKSTQPILIKHWTKEAKVFEKAEDIKQDDVLEVVEDQEPVKQLTQLEVNEEKVQLSFKDLESTCPSLREKKSEDSNNKKKSRLLRNQTGHPTSNQSSTLPVAVAGVDPPESVIDIRCGSKSEIDESTSNFMEKEVLMHTTRMRRIPIDGPPPIEDLRMNFQPHPGPWGIVKHICNAAEHGFYETSCITRRSVFIGPVEMNCVYPQRSFIPVVQRVQPTYIRRWLSKLPSQYDPLFYGFTQTVPVFLPQPLVLPQVYSHHCDGVMDGGKYSAHHKYGGKRSNDRIDHKRNAPFGDMTSQIIFAHNDQLTTGPLDSSYVTINIPSSNERLSGGSASCGLESHRPNGRLQEDNVPTGLCNSNSFHHPQSQYNATREKYSEDIDCRQDERKIPETLVPNNLMKSSSPARCSNDSRESQTPTHTTDLFPVETLIGKNEKMIVNSGTQVDFEVQLQQRGKLKAKRKLKK